MSIKNGYHSLWFAEYYSSEGQGLCALNRTLIHLKKTAQRWLKNIHMDLSSPGPWTWTWDDKTVIACVKHSHFLFKVVTGGDRCSQCNSLCKHSGTLFHSRTGAVIVMYHKVYELNVNYSFQSHLKVDFNIVARATWSNHIAQLQNYRL